MNGSDFISAIHGWTTKICLVEMKSESSIAKMDDPDEDNRVLELLKNRGLAEW